jgi:hypothetical protein
MKMTTKALLFDGLRGRLRTILIYVLDQCQSIPTAELLTCPEHKIGLILGFKVD